MYYKCVDFDSLFSELLEYGGSVVDGDSIGLGFRTRYVNILGRSCLYNPLEKGLLITRPFICTI